MIDAGTASMPVFLMLMLMVKQILLLVTRVILLQKVDLHTMKLHCPIKYQYRAIPEFTLVSSNFGSFQQYNYKNIYPAFGRP